MEAAEEVASDRAEQWRRAIRFLCLVTLGSVTLLSFFAMFYLVYASGDREKTLGRKIVNNFFWRDRPTDDVAQEEPP